MVKYSDPATRTQVFTRELEIERIKNKGYFKFLESRGLEYAEATLEEQRLGVDVWHGGFASDLKFRNYTPSIFEGWGRYGGQDILIELSQACTPGWATLPGALTDVVHFVWDLKGYKESYLQALAVEYRALKAIADLHLTLQLEGRPSPFRTIGTNHTSGTFIVMPIHQLASEGIPFWIPKGAADRFQDYAQGLTANQYLLPSYQPCPKRDLYDQFYGAANYIRIG